MLDVFLVGIGGFVGTAARYLIGLIPVKNGSAFPWKTLAINILGAFVIGLVSALAVKNESMDRHLVLMLKVGLCGGFTTFSTFAYENADLLKNGQTWISVLYMALSLAVGIAAVFAAQALVQ
jgi:CrcB protein